MKKLFAVLSVIAATAGISYAQTPSTYNCIPTITTTTPVYAHSCSNGYYISNVKTTGATLNISNTSVCNDPTSNYVYNTGAGNILQVDAGNKITVTIGYKAPGQQLQRSVFWIDFDHMNDFNNTSYPAPGGELINATILATGIVPPSSSGFDFTVPLTAKHGLTRMRVRTFGAENNPTAPPAPPATATVDACLTPILGVNGETEDYDVFINNPCTAVGGILFKNLTSKGVDVQWKLKGNEKQFEYVVDKNPADPGTGNTYVNGATRSLHIPDDFMKYIDCDAKYYFHIRAICDTDSHFTGSYYYGPWTTESFTTPPCCNTPALDVVNITSYTADATWGPVTSVQAYAYAIQADTITPSGPGTILTTTGVHLPGLQCSKEYYFFLRALCSPTPTSDWIVDSFLTQPCLGIDNTSTLPDFKLNAYPNPVKDVVTLSVMHGMKLTNANITVTDLTGKVLITQVMEGDKTQVDLRELPSGLYLIKYADEARTQVVKVHKE